LTIDGPYPLKDEVYRCTEALTPQETFDDLYCADFTHVTARVACCQLRRLKFNPYSYALVWRGLCGAWEEGEDLDLSLVVGMQYTRAVGVMVLDTLTKSEDQLETVEQRLAQVEDVTATNDDIQNMEMTLGREIGEVWSNLREVTCVWGEHLVALTWEWEQEKLAMKLVMQAQQQSLHGSVHDLIDALGVLQERELVRIHHVGNPIIIEDVEELELFAGTTDVDTVYKDAWEVQVVTELVEILD
jgi:hypothetical protein